MHSLEEIKAINKTKTATITIGRNVGRVPMNNKQWSFFQFDVRSIAEKLGTVYFAGGSFAGSWKGVKEDNYTVVYSLVVGEIPRLKRKLTTLKRTYKQESIALTIGDTVLL